MNMKNMLAVAVVAGLAAFVAGCHTCRPEKAYCKNCKPGAACVCGCGQNTCACTGNGCSAAK
ncbi:MAG TPA: hypothetical protein DDY72_04770 [Verrucomicrobia bacterium]|nr:hypothetical protein [Verrucomicrobiota bacterium]